MDRIALGVSSCLLGNAVRYDGGQKRDCYIIDTIGKAFSFLPVCPEVEAGLSIPREPMELVGDPRWPRLVVIGSTIDLTGILSPWAGRKARQLAKQDISGFILKARSPSCAVDDARIAAQGRMKKGAGLFSSVLAARLPGLPVIDEERLADPVLRENFIERVFLYRRWLALKSQRPSLGRLVAFHSDHKLQIMAHSLTHYAELGRFVAHAKGKPPGKVYDTYRSLLFEGMRQIATPKKHANVLMHVMGYFKRQLSAGYKQELLASIENFRMGKSPLIVPVTLLKHHLHSYSDPYLQRQTYLDPDPRELLFRASL